MKKVYLEAMRDLLEEESCEWVPAPDYETSEENVRTYQFPRRSCATSKLIHLVERAARACRGADIVVLAATRWHAKDLLQQLVEHVGSENMKIYKHAWGAERVVLHRCHVRFSTHSTDDAMRLVRKNALVFVSDYVRVVEPRTCAALESIKASARDGRCFYVSIAS